MKRILFPLIFLLFTVSQVSAGLNEGLVVYLTFDNVRDKKVLDASGNNLDADAIANVDFIKGKYGNGIHIAAEPEGDDCVRVPVDDLLKIEDEITMMAWVYHEDWEIAWGSWLDRGSQDRIDTKLSYSMGFFEAHIPFWGPKIGMILGTVQGSWKFITTGPMKNKNWHHIAETYDGRTMRIYLDGIIRSETVEIFGFMGTNDSELHIGCAVGHPRYTFRNGSIDEVGLWRRALIQDEIKTAMQDIFAVSPKDKVSTTWGDIKRRTLMH
ncbi:LamG domain-containing protein [Candidatus Poribacteria bacterium]|nr:LamG domain-containing protein [Candidatus Poribacteria bacterium]